MEPTFQERVEIEINNAISFNCKLARANIREAQEALAAGLLGIAHIRALEARCVVWALQDGLEALS